MGGGGEGGVNNWQVFRPSTYAPPWEISATQDPLVFLRSVAAVNSIGNVQKISKKSSVSTPGLLYLYLIHLYRGQQNRKPIEERVDIHHFDP